MTPILSNHELHFLCLVTTLDYSNNNHSENYQLKLPRPCANKSISKSKTLCDNHTLNKGHSCRHTHTHTQYFFPHFSASVKTRYTRTQPHLLINIPIKRHSVDKNVVYLPQKNTLLESETVINVWCLDNSTSHNCHDTLSSEFLLTKKRKKNSRGTSLAGRLQHASTAQHNRKLI